MAIRHTQLHVCKSFMIVFISSVLYSFALQLSIIVIVTATVTATTTATATATVTATATSPVMTVSYCLNI